MERVDKEFNGWETLQILLDLLTVKQNGNDLGLFALAPCKKLTYKMDIELNIT